LGARVGLPAVAGGFRQAGRLKEGPQSRAISGKVETGFSPELR
jgi:hypothetical protein